MKKIFTLFVLLLTTVNLLAAILTVDNNYPQMGQFSNLQDAHDAANPGDTIYIFPSNVWYDGITITKKLILIGTGFDYNSVNNSVEKSIINSNIVFNEGSAGSKIIGLEFQSQNPNFTTVGIVINDSNISVERNKLMRININSNLTGIVILNNFILDNTSPPYQAGAIQVENLNEIIIKNNLIIRDLGGNSDYAIQLKGQNISGLIVNNVIKVSSLYHPGNVAIERNNSNCLVYNNITEYGQYLGNYGDNYSYNICGSDQLAASNGNIPNTKMVDVFVDPDNYDFRLKEGSPALGSGLNGVDMGIYGGDTPFVDGGYPPIPSIYFLEVPISVNKEDGLDVTIKAKTNK